MSNSLILHTKEDPMLKKFVKSACLFLLFVSINAFAQAGIVVVQTDFGLRDGAVSAVKGVMYSVDKSLVIADLTNDIPAFNIWEAAYRLYQTANYWPKGTVFVSVVDPGVGTTRHSVVAEANNGQYFVTPDNGTLTLIADTIGIKEIRTIDEKKNRLKGSAESYTFHGRDVYGYTAARLASGKISFAEVGPISKDPIVKLPYEKATIKNNILRGSIDILDIQYGNVWTNIPNALVKEFGIQVGDKFKVKIFENNSLIYSAILPFHNTFGEVKKGATMLYLNSLLNLSLGINQNSFAKVNHVNAGPGWTIVLEKLK